MSTASADRLYNLLPAIYRIRDAGEGEPLRALMAVLAAEARKLETDIAGLYDNWFIETCDEWVVPYIGDLLGVRGLRSLRSGTFSRRAYVANTLAYRRRKGTAAVLEQLARDVTGWPARVVEFFALLGTTQHQNHIRLQNVRTPDLRDTNRLGLLDTPFDTIGHTAEVRRIAVERGKYNIPNVGLFLWRLQSYAVALGTPRPAADPPDGRYWFSPLGNDAPLFTRPQTEREITQLADETNVPQPIRQAAFFTDLQSYQARYASVPPADRPADSIYYGPNGSLDIIAGGEPVPPPAIMCMDLRNWDRPPAGRVGVDVRRGRLAFATGETPNTVQVSYNYGFSADIGGGPYDRRRAPAQPGQDAPGEPDTVAAPAALDALIRVPSTGINTLADALAAWDPATAPRTVIQIDDNRTYEENLTIPMAGAELVIQAANRKRPVLLGDIVVTGGTGAESLTLDGLLIAGALNLPGNLAAVTLTHCTLVPGRGLDETGAPRNPGAPSVIAAASNDQLQLIIDHSITGALRVSEEIAGLTVADSIVDSPTRGGRASILPVLISGNLAPFPALGPDTPRVVNVTIGDDGPYPATLPGVPTTLADARDQLQTAIQAAHAGDAFTGARVISVANRLVVLPGAPGAVVIEPAGADNTATQLRLVADAARQVYALVSGSLAGFTGLQAGTPQINVTIGGDGPHLATLGAVPTTPAQARDQLQAAIQAADSAPAFTGTLVATLDDRLVVLPGTDRTEVVFSPAPGDSTTIGDLALETDRPAIAASEGGQAPGPPATLERATIFGATYVKELTLASEVVFTGVTLVAHRQTGCVRFSYVPPASRTPQRYRCQPDLEITAQIAAAEQEARAHNTLLTPADAAAIAARVRAALRPAFTASRYGRAAYGQLSATCPTQITTGADDGAEMGAFNSLQGAVREANLRAALTEHLRFGLEAGIFYVT
jgi:tail protein P2 I